MDFFSHLVFGALMYLLFLRNITLDYLFIALFFVILPDLDIFIAPLKRIFKSNYLEHRGGSHSYIVGIIISFIIALIFSSLLRHSFIMVWIIGSLFYGVHISQDILTTTKIPYLYPLSRKERGFYVEKAGSLYTMINSMLFLNLLIIGYFASATMFYFKLVIDFYTYFYLFYYFYRIVSKAWFNSNLDDNQKYLPGVLPFYFLIFNREINNDLILLSVIKKAHFLKAKEIISIKATLNKQEMEIFRKAMAMCQDNYYYAKWTMLPIFTRKDDVFSIKFFFLETMIRKKTVYIQYDFNLITQQIIEINQNYGRIKS